MAIERNTTPEQMQAIKRMRETASPLERQLLDELSKALEGKRVRFKHPVYGRIIDYWCPTENLAVCLDVGIAESTATFEVMRRNRVPVIFVALDQVRGNPREVVREIMSLRPRARLHNDLVYVGSRAPASSASKEKPKENRKVESPKSKLKTESVPAKKHLGISASLMKPISNELRPGRAYYALVLPNGRGVVHADWIKFRSQVNSHKGCPAAAFDAKADAEAWVRARSHGDLKPKTKKVRGTEREVENKPAPEAIPDIEITDEYKAALDIMENSRRNVFITGKAGTGKSTLLKYFRLTTAKKLAVLAPTGIAAVNVRGQTIHSFFQFPTQYLDPDLYSDFKGQSIHKQLEAIIIDEISMVRAELLDAIDHFLRAFGPHAGKAFGGIQIICFGDPFQLPPVVRDDLREIFSGRVYKSPYFFSSSAFKNGDFACLELSKVYRQQEREFIGILNQVRTGFLDEAGLRLLNARVREPDPKDTEPALVLSTHNSSVDQINADRLARLPGNPRTYHAKAKGHFGSREKPVEEAIQLKVGAQVMMLRNNIEKGYYNGTVGQVVELGDDCIVVEIRKRSGKVKKVHVEPIEFESVRHTVTGDKINGKVVGSLKQIPVRLAWASTIHKAQGKTLDKVILDLTRGAFEVGQTYVALSRCTSLEGLFLRKPITAEDIKSDPIVEKFRQHFFPQSPVEEEDGEGRGELDADFDRAMLRE